MWSTSTGSFDLSALERRVASPRTATRLAREQPASYAAFDVLEYDGSELRPRLHADRRSVLTELAGTWSPPMTLSPATDDAGVAATWFRDLAPAGIEGLVAKGRAQPYRAGRRDWLKIKHRSVIDVVCAAVIGPLGAPEAAVAGLPIDSELRIVGRTTSLSGIARRDLARQITTAGDEHPWPPVVPASAVHGFGAPAANRSRSPGSTRSSSRCLPTSPGPGGRSGTPCGSCVFVQSCIQTRSRHPRLPPESTGLRA